MESAAPGLDFCAKVHRWYTSEGRELRAMLVVDPWHWMSEDEWFPDDNPTLRKNLLRVARLIEYGAELEP